MSSAIISSRACSGSAPRSSRSASAAKSSAGTTSEEPAGKSAGFRLAAMSALSATADAASSAANAAPDSAELVGHSFPGQAGRAAFPHRARRADGQFPDGDPDLRGVFRDVRNAAHAERGRRRPAGKRGCRLPASGSATASIRSADRTRRRSKFFAALSCSGQVRPFRFEITRGGDAPRHRRTPRRARHPRRIRSGAPHRPAWRRPSSPGPRATGPDRAAPRRSGLHFINDTA